VSHASQKHFGLRRSLIVQGSGVMPNPRPILIFDSGVGGLSVLEEIRKSLPLAPLIYAADNGWHPYGTKSEAEIAARVPALLGRLAERYRPRIIVIACNTAATIALSDVRAALDLPIVGTVPAVKPAALASKSRVIGILGTEATVRQPYVDRLVAEFASDCLVLRLGSADLVRIAEAKLRGTAPDRSEIEAIMQGLFGQDGGDRIDQIVLACTHFPLLRCEIEGACPPAASLVDSGQGIARRTAYLMRDELWPASLSDGVAVFTREDADATLLAPALRGYGLTGLEFL
jgi:glutamate racemase